MNICINNTALSACNSLPIDALSNNVQVIISTYADVFQCSRDMIVSAIFAITGAAVGKKLTINSGKYKNYPCLWMVNVADSGSNKSAPIKALLQPMREVDAVSYQSYIEEVKAQKKDEDKQHRPVFHQHLISDSTPEARNSALSSNPNGLLLYRDEIKGFFDDMGRYNKSGEVSQVLSLFDSDNIVINRKSEATLLIDKPFMSLLGSIQPDVLPSTLGNDLMMSNGLNQRLLFCFPNATLPSMYEDNHIPDTITGAWSGFIKNLMGCDFSYCGGELILNNAAKDIYIEYYNRLQSKKADSDSYMGAVYSKLQIQILRWAGITHLLGNHPDVSRILPEGMEYSVRCMDYFEGCALKVYNKLMEGKKTNTTQIGNEEMVARFYYANHPKSQRAFADAIGVSQPFVAKCIKKYERLSSYRLSDTQSIDNECVTDN